MPKIHRIMTAEKIVFMAGSIAGFTYDVKTFRRFYVARKNFGRFLRST